MLRDMIGQFDLNRNIWFLILCFKLLMCIIHNYTEITYYLQQYSTCTYWVGGGGSEEQWAKFGIFIFHVLSTVS